MSKITKEEVLAVLSEVKDPSTGRNVVSAGLITSVFVRDGKVGFALLSIEEEKAAKDKLRVLCENKVKSLEGVETVTSVLTEHNSVATEREQKEQEKAARKRKTERVPPQPIPGVSTIIAVASGKGGVGKSTTAVNIAVALASLGYRTGLLDADIYGPSIPHMMSIKEKPEVQNNKMIPTRRYGVQCISVGMLIDPDTSIAWRGPMVTKALAQLFRGTLWNDVDILVVDMPPGTGDIHLSLAEHYPIDGAIVVSTPQDIALLDARRGVDLFNKVSIPIIGIVENMSYYEDDQGKRSYIFGEGGAKHLAEELNVDLLGEISLNQAIREGGDCGEPLVNTRLKQGKTSEYLDLAKRIALNVKKIKAGKTGKNNSKAVSY